MSQDLIAGTNSRGNDASPIGSAKSHDSKHIFADDWQTDDVGQLDFFTPILIQFNRLDETWSRR